MKEQTSPYTFSEHWPWKSIVLIRENNDNKDEPIKPVVMSLYPLTQNEDPQMLPSLSSFICLYPSFWIIAVSTQTYFHLKQTRKQTNQQIPLQPTSYSPSFWPISLLPLADILKRSVRPHSCQFLSSRGLWSTSPSGLPPTSLQSCFCAPVLSIWPSQSSHLTSRMISWVSP